LQDDSFHEIRRRRSPVSDASNSSCLAFDRSLLSVYPTGANDNRLNARMAELLASSSSTAVVVDDGDQKNLSLVRSSEETSSNDSSRLPTKVLHRRIVNMLDSLRKPTEESTRDSSGSSWKSPPITFGQLRQATISSQPSASSIRLSTDERSDRHGRLLVRNNYSDVTSRSSTPLNQSSADSRTGGDAPSLSVEGILAKYYPTNESETPGAFFIHPSTSRLIGDEQSQRPPPPSYSSSLAQSHQASLSAEQSSLRYGMETSNSLPQRPPPPQYRSPSSSVDRSQSVETTSNLPKGFDRQFSRLLYGKDRRVKQKRKSFSDPVR
jgi:hypothetical protein